MAEPPWHLQETYRGLVTLSTDALKALALVNGGAAVALLTYLGHGTTPSHANVLFLIALGCWCLGLLLTTLAFIVAYVTQLRLFQEERDRVAGRAFSIEHPTGIKAGIVCATLAAVLFGFGCLFAALGL